MTIDMNLGTKLGSRTAACTHINNVGYHDLISFEYINIKFYFGYLTNKMPSKGKTALPNTSILRPGFRNDCFSAYARIESGSIQQSLPHSSPSFVRDRADVHGEPSPLTRVHVKKNA